MVVSVSYGFHIENRIHSESIAFEADFKYIKLTRNRNALMLPIRLFTSRYPGGFHPISDMPGILAANPSLSEPFDLEAPNLEDPIFVRLLNCRTDDDFIHFANGFFDEVHVGIGDATGPTGKVINLPSLATQLRLAMVVAVMGDGHRDRGNPFLDRLLESARLRPRMVLVDGATRLVLEATSVRDFMALEVASACEAGAQINGCSHCSNFFLFGPYTGRRSHGKFCSTRCRVAAMRMRNASKKVDKQ
jgi:hypothetical protein